ncbi:MAG: NADH-quinone oxidoreductase subunit N [Candidatus Zixiibacteriota bacterium]|nr:MAG: NADH-quinone oxidoreductase subunit N [candidate division Zixibacteria bacterium]
MDLSRFNLITIATPLVLGAGVLLVMLVDLLSGRANRRPAQLAALAVVLAAAAVCLATWNTGGVSFFGQVSGDGFASFFNLIFLAVAFLVILAGPAYLERNAIHFGEYYSLVLVSVMGMAFMAAGTNLLVIFLGLETMSLALYVLAGFNPARQSSNEASLKYLLLGSFATGFLVFGIALVYGQIGSTDLARFSAYLAGAGDPFAGYMGAGVALLLIGLTFKMAVVPFHFWSPDVYDGAPTVVSAFMSAAPKAAAFAAALRIFYAPAESLGLPWERILWILAALTMTVGNLSALNQASIKRMLAYSSVAHAGYLLLGILAGNELGAAGILFYLASYVFMNVGAFTVAWMVNRRGEGRYDLGDFAQLGFRRPLLAAMMSVFMLGLIGIPPLAGFFGKLYVFTAAVQAGYVWLVVIAVLNSAVSVFYYLRVMVIMYMRENEALKDVDRIPATFAAVAACALMVILLGLIPGSVLDVARAAVASMP